MKKNELKEKKVEELREMLAKAREELREVRFATAGARSGKGAAPSTLRRSIARLMTELGSRRSA